MKKTEWPRIKVNKLYKLLDKNGFSYDCGDAEYSLPTKREDGTWEPGEWMTGYHLCREEDILRWLKFDVNESIFEAECRGEIIENRGILVARKARLVRKCNENWNEKTVRLFACWCVREVWNLLSDKRSKQAVEIAERFANGNASKEELRAARFAAWDAEDEASVSTN